MNRERRAALALFYELIDELGRRCGGVRTLATCTGTQGWPRRGVYFFFEDGEFREDQQSRRVVRVGTHGLRPSKSTLWQRLGQHKGTTGGSLSGGGNHRGSIFRLHVGAALLATGDWPEQVRASWGIGSSASPAVRSAEHTLECAVSDYIGAMPFFWLAVDDEPSAASERGVIEAGAIALLSNLDRPAIDPASPRWLGHASARATIRGSGLWNVNHVNEPASAEFLATLERWVRA